MKTKYYLLIANAIFVGLMDFLICYFTESFNVSMILSLVFLNITLVIPSIYILFASNKKLNSSINEVLLPSFITSILFVVINVIASSIFFVIAKSKDDYMPLIITEISLFAVYFIVLCIIFAITSHIRKVFKEGKNE